MIGNFANFCLPSTLMARKIAKLFGLNRGVWPFYAACCFDVLSRGSVSCLLNASFKTAVSQRHNLIFWAKIDDHDVHGGNTGQILAQWWRLMASRVALDLPSWAMHLALYAWFAWPSKWLAKQVNFFPFVDFMSCITVAKQPCYGPLKVKPSYIIVHYYVIS